MWDDMLPDDEQPPWDAPTVLKFPINHNSVFFFGGSRCAGAGCFGSWGATRSGWLGVPRPVASRPAVSCLNTEKASGRPRPCMWTAAAQAIPDVLRRAPAHAIR